MPWPFWPLLIDARNVSEHQNQRTRSPVPEKRRRARRNPPPLPRAVTRSSASSARVARRRSTSLTTPPLDRDVAFALIKTEGLDEIGRQRIEREAQAMGRLGDHPHIVTVYDVGEEKGQPYMVSQLMPGGDVEGLIEQAPEHRLPLEDVPAHRQRGVCRPRVRSRARHRPPRPQAGERLAHRRMAGPRSATSASPWPPTEAA